MLEHLDLYLHTCNFLLKAQNNTYSTMLFLRGKYDNSVKRKLGFCAEFDILKSALWILLRDCPVFSYLISLFIYGFMLEL